MINIIGVILSSAVGFVVGWLSKPSKKIDVKIIELDNDKLNEELKNKINSFFRKDMDDK